MLTLGTMRVHLINDSDTWADPGGPFGLVPRLLWSRYKAENDERLVHMPTHCLVVQQGAQVVVVDTGLGRKMDAKTESRWHLGRPQGDLIDGLARIGLAPGDVTLVIDTHLHADHCSGNTRFVDDDPASGEVVAAFPNAEYVVQRREYEDAMRPNERTRATYLLENYAPLVERGQMRLLDGDTELLPGVRVVVTPGHTPGHQSVILESEGESLMYVCDMASYAVHFERLGWMTAYDVEPLVTLETKRRWQTWAINQNALMVFPHDADMPAARLVMGEKERPTLQAVQFVYS